LGESIGSIKKTTEVLFVTSREAGLEVNAEKTMYVFMSCEQNAGQYHNINISNKSFESVVNFKYLETTPTNQNCVHEEIKSRLSRLNSE
jgi:hypothetical protein